VTAIKACRQTAVTAEEQTSAFKENLPEEAATRRTGGLKMPSYKSSKVRCSLSGTQMKLPILLRSKLRRISRSRKLGNIEIDSCQQTQGSKIKCPTEYKGEVANLTLTGFTVKPALRNIRNS
jgi:hypothetical protein